MAGSGDCKGGDEILQNSQKKKKRVSGQLSPRKQLRVFTADLLSLQLLLLLPVCSFTPLRLLPGSVQGQSTPAGLRSRNRSVLKWFLLCQESHAWFFLGGCSALSAHSGGSSYGHTAERRSSLAKPRGLAWAGSLSAGLVKYDGPWYWPRAPE